MNRGLILISAVLVAPGLLRAQASSSAGAAPVTLQRVQAATVPSPQQYPFAAIKQGLESSQAVSSVKNAVIPGSSSSVVPKSFVARKNVPLTPTAYDALAASKSIVRTENKPVTTADGKVVYTYGVGLPEIVCAPLRVCTLELQAGEKISGEPQIGDSTRWLVTPCLEGTGKFAKPVLVIKPTAVDLDTTMVITTDRRIYYVRLISKANGFVARTAFSYADDEHVQWQMFLAKQAKEKQQELAKSRVATMSGTAIDSMYFDYRIRGKKRWFGRKYNTLKPVRVMDDGKKTYIEMPEAALHRELPVLVIEGPTGDEMVNYRVKGNIYIVDRLFNRAAILLGSGKHQVCFWIDRKKSVQQVDSSADSKTKG